MAGDTSRSSASTSFTAQFFGSQEYSDVTVKFSGREVHCHKLILCSKSDYFKKLCGPDSAFVEQNQREITLLDDDPDAVETVLRHLYTDRSELARPDDVAYLLEVSKAADKYLLPVLRDAAHMRLEKLTAGYTDVEQVFQAAHIIRARGTLPANIKLADSLEDKHISALLMHEPFRKDVEKSRDFAFLWRVITRLNFAEDMVLATLVRCERCLGTQYKSAGSNPRSYCWAGVETTGNKKCKCKYDYEKGRRCWMSKKDLLTHNGEMARSSLLKIRSFESSEHSES